MHIIIFKTNVATTQQVRELQVLLHEVLVISQCNFDLDDCDRILRIVSTDPHAQIVCRLLQTKGFDCEVMESFLVPVI
ncbi:hypothetical protein [Pedobacter metabolipauper]|uniref:Uncharacterized protein n=1 Tax=Pedobacter metabolipauper TaxID=425513 RepID=A0A4R6T3A5_9SPHI|nr:hypothetical protein [Pedobacter metabolipauper]TDQ11851.1 hypothetical protein ATK78_0981 [Pedobacter metabolipauper]